MSGHINFTPSKVAADWHELMIPQLYDVAVRLRFAVQQTDIPQYCR